MVLSTAFISGFSVFINKIGVAGADPYFYTFIKNIIAGAALTGILLLAKNWRSIFDLNRADKIKLFLIGLIGGSIPFLLFFKGLSMTTAFKAGFIHKTLFIYVGILALIFLKEKVSKIMLVGFASLLLGSFLFLQVKPQALNWGDLYVFAAVLFWAVEIIIAKQVLKDVSGTIVGGARLLIGSVFIFGFLLFTDRADLFGSLNLEIIKWGVISGLILAGYNWTFYNGLKYIGAGEAVAILTLGVPVTGVLTLVFLDGSLTAGQMFGTGFILLGVILVSKIAGKFLRLDKVLKLRKVNE